MFNSTFSGLPQPSLSVSKSVISDTDSVTLSCHSSEASASECSFYSEDTSPVVWPSCLYRVTATKLLSLAHKNSPAEVKIQCFYTVMQDGIKRPSPHSKSVFIFVQSESFTFILYTLIYSYISGS